MKKIVIRVLALLLCVSALAGILPAKADAASVIIEGDISYRLDGDVRYVLDSNGTLTISGTGRMYFYPDSKPWAQHLSDIKTLVIESGVTHIHDGAFSDCTNLTSVTLPDTLTNIGKNAFQKCAKLTSLVIPNSVKTIGSAAFSDSGLTSITFSDAMNIIPEKLLHDCKNLTSITLPKELKEIGKYAFQGCSSLEEISLPDTVTTIGNYAFWNCKKLNELSVPASVTNIGACAFNGCYNLSSITFLGDAPVFGSNVFTGITTRCYYPADNDTWTKDAMQNNADYSIRWMKEGTVLSGQEGKNITWEVSKDNVMTISGEGAMPDVYYTADWAAAKEYAESVVIQPGVTYIGSDAFNGFTKMTAISIPDSVMSIGRGAFEYLNLTSVVLPNGIARLEARMFHDCKNLTTVILPEELREIGNAAFSGCSALTDISIPGKVTKIEDHAFMGCDALGSISIPDSVLSIGKSAFTGCASLDWISFRGDAPAFAADCFGALTTRCYYPANNPTWTQNVMQNNANKSIFWLEEGTNLSGTAGESIAWELSKDNVLTISGEGSMEDTYKEKAPWYDVRKFIDAVVIQSGVNHIGSYAFYELTNLRTVDISETVTSIGNYAFWKSGLVNVQLPSSVTCLEFSAFEDCKNLESAVIPGSVGQLNSNLFKNCEKLSKVTLGEGITQIGLNAFCGCHRLKTVEIPSTVTELRSNAFRSCLDLKEIIFKGNTPYIYNDAFSSVKATAYYPDNDTTWTSSVRKDYGGKIAWEPYHAAHHYAPLVTAPTCTEKGYTTYTCRCGDTYTDDEVPASGHDFGEWTKAEKDLERRNCRNCDHFETRKVEIVKPKAPVIDLEGISSSGKNKVTWKKVAGAEEYQVYRATSKDGKYTKLTTTSKTSYTDKSAKAGTKYYYKVRAVSEDGIKSSYSNIEYRYCDLPRPEVEESNVSSSGKIKLEWKKIEGAKEYEIYRATSKSGTYKKIATTDDTDYTDKTAKAGKVYYYKVKAIHKTSSANSAYSSVVGQTCKLERPDVSIKLSSGNPKLTWDEVDGAEKYEVYRATSKSGTYKLVKTTTSEKFTDKTAKSGQTYYYKVKAIHKNENANSAYSSVDSIKAK